MFLSLVILLGVHGGHRKYHEYVRCRMTLAVAYCQRLPR